MRRGRSFILTAILTLLIATAAYAFTAANTVPASYAGDGSGAINGYTVSAIAYTLDAANPTLIKSVAFTLNTAASSAYVSVTGAAPYQGCTISGGVNVSCTFGTEPAVTAATSLRVIANS
ncbi:MAG: hypothetical protein ABSC51_09410 [Gaiellaceae bacterium]|jgi:hypothetical protein